MNSNANRSSRSTRRSAKSARRSAGKFRRLPAAAGAGDRVSERRALRALLRRSDIRALRAALAARGGEGWIVGGAARDLLLGRFVSDVDLAVSADPFELARDLASAGFGTAVFLSEAGPRVARVAGKHEIDLAAVEGGGVVQDLERRDFTVNALAIPLGGGPWLDPFGGIRDLTDGRLRMIAEKNFEDDPLRALRAARFIATHGLTPDEATTAAARRVAPLLSSAAPERIRVELVKLLGSERAEPALAWAARAGLLVAALEVPGFDAARERAIARPSPLDDARVRRRLPEERVRLRLALLASGLSLSGAAAAAWLAARRFSHADSHAAGRLLSLATAARIAGDADARWAWVRDAGSKAQASEALLLARLLGPGPAARSALDTLPRMVRRAGRPPRISGLDVIAWTGLPAGPAIGRILREIEIAGLRGRIRTRAQARLWLEDRGSESPLIRMEEEDRARPEL